MNTTIKWCVRKDEHDNHGACKSMRLHVDFPLQFWEDFVDTVVYLIRRGPSSSLDGIIIEEAWTCKKVNYSFLKDFGCESFVHIDKENRTNLEAKYNMCTFIGCMVLMILVIAYGIMKITKSLGLEMSYSMRRSCTKISCR